MAVVFLGVGSNIERERYIVAGLDALQQLFGHLSLSPVYESDAIGFDGEPFLNLVVRVETQLGVGALQKALRHIEFEHGRPQNASRFSARQLDIDILTYDDRVGDVEGVELPRGEILDNAFVLRPLSELAPDDIHPASGRTYARHWDEYDAESQPLRRFDLSWRGRPVGDAVTLDPQSQEAHS